MCLSSRAKNDIDRFPRAAVEKERRGEKSERKEKKREALEKRARVRRRRREGSGLLMLSSMVKSVSNNHSRFTPFEE